MSTVDITKKLDSAKLSRYHFTAVFISGAGFFTDAYDLFVISLVVPMISVVYFNNKLTDVDSYWIKGVALAGALIGQVMFGLFGDFFGRKTTYLGTLILMIFATLGQAFAANTVRGVGVVTVLCVWRLVMGIGVGGDYPLSAVITSEYANIKNRGALLTAVFGMQGVGIVTAAIASLITVKAFEGAITDDYFNVDYVWRILIGLGCLPALLTIYARSRLPETMRYTMQCEDDEEQAREDYSRIEKKARVDVADVDSAKAESVENEKISFGSLMRYLGRDGNWKILVGTAGTWFLLDVAFYSTNLFTPLVIAEIGFSVKPKMPANASMCPADPSCAHVSQMVYDYLYKTCAGQAITGCMGLPGYYVTLLLIDRVGRKPIQLQGFAALTVLLVILASAYDQLVKNALAVFVILYALLFFFCNFGPNTTTFVWPSEVFPTQYRSTLHGISAGCGKAGAVLGVYAFGELNSHQGLKKTLWGMMPFMAVGFFLTFLIPETKGRSLEEISRRPDHSKSGKKAAATNGV